MLEPSDLLLILLLIIAVILNQKFTTMKYNEDDCTFSWSWTILLGIMNDKQDLSCPCVSIFNIYLQLRFNDTSLQFQCQGTGQSFRQN